MTKEKPNLFQQAAKASMFTPVIVLVLGFISFAVAKEQYLKLGFGVVNSILLVAGMVMGIIALCGIKKHGTKAILIPAIIGIIFNGFFITFGTFGYFLAKNMKEKAISRQKEEFALSQQFFSIVKNTEKTFFQSLGEFSQKPTDNAVKEKLKKNLSALKQEIQALNQQAIDKRYDGLQEVTRCYLQAVKCWDEGIACYTSKEPDVLKGQKKLAQGDNFKQQAVNLYNQKYVKKKK